MGFWNRPAAVAVEPAEPEPTPEELAALAEEARLAALAVERGNQFCSARQCKEETGLACSYIDRRDRHCPTAWCPEHRVITHGKLYCPAHAGLLEGTSNMFGVSANPDVGNTVPALVNWVTREVDADVTGIVTRIAEIMREDVVIEPVRFVLVGVDRVRTWERSWKTVSRFGVDLRLAVAVEERKPDGVLAKVNSKVVISVPPPWNEEYPVGPQPPDQAAIEGGVRAFRSQVFLALGRAAEAWRIDEMAKRAEEFADVDPSLLTAEP